MLERMLEDDLLGERIQTENYPWPRDYEFVWVDDSETIQNIETFSDKTIESDLDKQMEKLC